MPVKVAKSGKKFVVKDKAGKISGRHTTKKKAAAQASAINASLKRRGKI